MKLTITSDKNVDYPVKLLHAGASRNSSDMADTLATVLEFSQVSTISLLDNAGKTHEVHQEIVALIAYLGQQIENYHEAASNLDDEITTLKNELDDKELYEPLIKKFNADKNRFQASLELETLRSQG